MQGEDLLLLYIVGHGAIAKLDGEIQHLTGSESGFAWNGGRYEADGTVIEIASAESGSRTASVTVQSDGQSETFEGSWGCGS